MDIFAFQSRLAVIHKALALLIGVAAGGSIYLAREARAQADSMPADVSTFIGRRAGCQDLLNKATDPARLFELEKGLQSLKCVDLKADENALRERYATNLDVLADLDATWTKVVRRIPVEPYLIHSRP